MIAKTLITESIVPLKTSDTGAVALSFMDDYKISHLPIVNNQEFLGLISETDIYELNDFDAPLGIHTLSLKKPYIHDYQHVFDVIRIISEQELTLVPVLDDKNNYLGSITLKNLVDHFADITAVNNPGGVIVLEMSSKDYSLSEIAQIVESNNAKVLSLFVTTHSDSTKLEVTVKINKIDIGPILQTLNRYNYVIKASFTETDYLDGLKDRYDSFMKYLNI